MTQPSATSTLRSSLPRTMPSASVPPRVEYALTEKGRALVPIIESMRSYGTEWLGAADACSETPEVPLVAAVA